MTTNIRHRYCPQCGSRTLLRWHCNIDLSARRRWAMSPERIRAVHVLARSVKGLDEETYRLRLAAVGVTSCKELSRAQFAAFMAGLRALPDARRSPARPHAPPLRRSTITHSPMEHAR